MTDTGFFNLKGSTDFVAKFFGYAITNILYQREVYPREDFESIVELSGKQFVPVNPQLKDFLNKVLTQVRHWLSTRNIQRLVLVIMNEETGEPVERWQFHVNCDKSLDGTSYVGTKSDKEAAKEAAAIGRQIVASNTFLPDLPKRCLIDVLVYADKDINTPLAWEESDPKYIQAAEFVQLKSLNTSVHAVEADVAFRSFDSI